MPDYQISMREELRVFVDETGFGLIEWRNACDLAETALQNVAILSPEEIADRLTESLLLQHERSPVADANAAVVTEIRLCAAAISEYQLDNPLSDLDEGLLVPCWEFEVQTNWGDSQPGGLRDVYRFSAVDGGTLPGRCYRKEPVS